LVALILQSKATRQTEKRCCAGEEKEINALH